MQEHFRDWAAAGDENATALANQCGCWKKVNENGHNPETGRSLWRSVLWQDMETSQCRLDFSGFSGSHNMTFFSSHKTERDEFLNTLAFPYEHMRVCGYKLWKPFVKSFRDHVRMEGENFTQMMEHLAGPNSTCRGDIIVTGLSLGGAMAEMVAGCANSGKLHEIFREDQRTNWTVGELYTFGPQAISLSPMKNGLNPGKGRCFKGRRFYINGDIVGGVMGIVNNRHPHLETVEFFRSKEGPSYRVYPCWSEKATKDGDYKAPPHLAEQFLSGHPLDMRFGEIPHSMVYQKEFIKWFVDTGILNFTSLDFPVDEKGRMLVPPDKLAGTASEGTEGSSPPGDDTADAAQD